MDDVRKIDNMLLNLNLKELEHVQKSIQLIMAPKQRERVRLGEEAFYSILDNELSKKLKTKAFPYNKFKRTHSYKLLGEAFEVTLDFMEVVFAKEKLTRIKKLHFYLIACKIVLDDQESSPAPLSIKTMLNGFKLLPGLIDRAFPGYARSGLLPMILKQKWMNKKPIEEVKNEKR